MGLKGKAKADYQRDYMRKKRSNGGLTGSNIAPDYPKIIATPFVDVPRRTKGRTPEECGYPLGQVEVRTGPQGQKLWRLNGHYDMPNRILCFKAGKGEL